MSEYKLNLKNNTLWSTIGQVGYMLIVFITNLILVRILSPDDFGVYSIAYFFIIIANVLIEGGVGGAIIRKKEVKVIDYTTLFTINFIISIILATLLVITAKWFSDYYEYKQLNLILKLVAINFLINAFSIVQTTYLVREMLFKKRALITLISISVSQIITLIIAHYTKNSISLIIGLLINSIIYLILSSKLTPIPFTFKFNKKSFKEIYSFGIFTTLSSIIILISDNIIQLILGKHFSLFQAGTYYQAKKIQEVPVNIIQGNLTIVAYSYLSKMIDKRTEFRNESIKIQNFIIEITAITTFLIFVFSDNFIEIFLGNKWTDSSYLLRLLGIIGFFSVLESLLRLELKLLNYPNLILYADMIKRIGMVSCLFKFLSTIKFLLFTLIIFSVFGYLINLYLCYRYTEINIYKWLKNTLYIKIFLGIFFIFTDKSIVDQSFKNKLIFIIIGILFFYLIFQKRNYLKYVYKN